jgi:hypothetical protein
MTAAVFGLVGVVIGGLLNGGITWAVTRATRKKQQRVALRLVTDELVFTVGALQTILTAKQWPSYGHGIMDAQEWREHKLVLAEMLPRDTWTRVCGFYRSLGAFLLAHPSAAGGVSAVPLDALKTVTERGEAARDALAQLVVP